MSTPIISLIIKYDDWPLSDQQQWAFCLSPGGLFDAGGTFSGWSKGTCRIHAQNYGSWLSFLMRCHPDLIALPPADRIKQDIVEAFILEGKKRLKLRSVSNQVRSLAITAKGFAPDKDWKWIFGAARKLYEQSNPTQLKPPLPISAADIFGWSLKQLRLIAGQTLQHPIAHAVTFRQALMVGLLIARPVRARAFMAMTVSKHIEISSSGISLSYTAEDMKDKKARRFPVPDELAPFMLEYLSTHRPILLNGASAEELWISSRGHPMTQDNFTSGLAKLTNRIFGLKLRPHAFRHIAATSIASNDPEHVGIIRDILGHTTLRMAEKHYNRATAVVITRRLQGILRNIRSDNHKKRKPKHRGQRIS